jgi:hypothetical protein
MPAINGTESLSFKITYTIKDCSDCPSRKHDPIGGKQLHEENCDGLTESCPVIDWMKR